MQATSEAGDSDVAAMSWWTNWGGGTVAGYAYIGTLCMDMFGYKTNLCEADASSQSISAWVSNVVSLLSI